MQEFFVLIGYLNSELKTEMTHHKTEFHNQVHVINYAGIISDDSLFEV